MSNSFDCGGLIPYNTIPPPGNIVVSNLLRPKQEHYNAYLIKILFENEPKIQAWFKRWLRQPRIAKERIEYDMLVCSLRWLYQKVWNSQYKIVSHPQKMIDALEPFGELLRIALLLCEQCYLYGNKFEYSHHLYWFGWITLDLFKFGFDAPDGKEELIKKLRLASASLRDSQNPFDPIETPALWRLTASALILIRYEGYPDLYPDYLTKKVSRKKKGEQKTQPIGLVTALSAWATQLSKSELCVVEATDTAITANIGQGKGKKIVRF